MADPLSITASIIAVIGAVEGVGKTLTKIRNIRNAPIEIQALINEVSDLGVILSDLEGYITQNTARPRLPQEQLHHISILLQRAKDRLLELDQLIEYRLLKPGSGSGSDQIQVSRREWAKAKGIIEKFRQSLRDIRLNIVAQMMVVSSSHQYRIGLTIDEIHIMSNQLQSSQTRTNQAVQQLDQHSILLGNIIHSQAEIRSLLQLRASPDGQPNVHRHEIAASTRALFSNSYISVRAHVSYNGPSYYRCACQQEQGFASPRLLHGALGMMFVGYSGYPLNTIQKCTEVSCQARKAFKFSVYYLFPTWLLARSLMISLINTSYNEIHISLTARRVVDAGAEVFRLVYIDDTDGLKRLFSQGLASPNDQLYLGGQTPLYQALNRNNVKACKFLLDAGADPFARTTSNKMSIFDQAWNHVFEARRDGTFLETLRGLFPVDDDYLEERQFSRLHKIVLDITSHNLSAELAASHADIDNVDNIGYTPLLWAARRGDSEAMNLLLKAGANPNIRISVGTSALMYATRSSFSCVKLLLEAGASPNDKDIENLNALHYAATYQDSAEMIEYLISRGVHLHEQDIFGSTPLAHAAFRNNAISALVLLDYGADIDSKDNDGDNPLLKSVRLYADDVMQLLLNRGANYTLLHHSGGSILHLAAQSGGLRTLEILRAAQLKEIDPDIADRHGKTPLQLARERVTKEEGFVEKFQTLLDDIRTRNASQTPIRDPINIAPSGLTRSTQLSWTKSIVQHHAIVWIADLFANFKSRFTRSGWTSIILYWVLGLGWAGFIYLLLFPARVRSGGQEEVTSSDIGGMRSGK